MSNNVRYPHSALILNQDKNWDHNRQVPLEPTRWGKIAVIERPILIKYPIIKKYLEKNQYLGSYFSDKTLRQRVIETQFKLSKTDRQLLKLAKDFTRKKDLSTAYLLNSLILDHTSYQAVEEQVHFRLSASMLGPNPTVVKPIIDAIIAYSKQKSAHITTILDPFAGNGSLGLIIAENLIKNGIDNFIVLNNDLSPQVYKAAKYNLTKLVPQRLQQVKKHLKFLHGDGLILNHIPNRSLDLIVSLRALHEHPQRQVKQFFQNCLQKVKVEGEIIIDDVTREKIILKRAKKLLPFLGQMTAFRLLTEKIITETHPSQLIEKFMNGDAYLSQAGIQSYVSGFLLSELQHLAQTAGFKTGNISGYYDYNTPFPLGSMQLRLSV